MMGTIRGQKRKKFGPLTLNFSTDGVLGWRLTSWGLRIGPWSWNARSDRHRVDLPGPWSWTNNSKHRPR